MYFNKIILFNFRRLIRQDKPFYAHIGESLKPETLEMHLELSLKYFEKIYDEKNLENVFTRFEKSFLGGVSDNALALWKKLILNMIYCHDLGKINPNFQRLKMDNLQWELTETNNSRHSFFSALIFFSYYFEEVDALENEEEYNLLFMLLLILSFIISKHHSSLMNFMDFVEKLEDTFLEETFLEEKKEELEGFLKPYNEALMEKAFIKETYECIVENWQGKDPWQCVNWYVFGRFLYGLLVSCDFYATSEYVNKTPVEALGVINNIDRYLEVFNDNVITQKIRNMEFTKPEKPDINILRSQLFIETEEKLLKHFDEHIFFMEAPTGSGKTRASINLALQLLNKNHELNKITYVFPFNTLVEQTKASLCECFNNDPKLTDLIAVVNGITPIKKYLDDGQMSDEGEWSLEKGEKIDYERSLLARQFLHYPIVLTTHVNLFESLFGFKRESAFPVAHLANSVIVLDEIQSYNNAIWKEIIIFLKAYAKLLNIKIIIMSATLPDLNNLCHDKSATTYLVENRDVYFQNPLFKKRVNLDFSLLESDIKKNIGILSEKVIDVFKVLKERVNCSNKILIEFISKKSAFSFYELMCEQLELMNTEATVFLMTGDDNKAERKHIIDAVNGGKNLILVATQVIEAGIDIDMDVGFKDTSLLDAEEQFLGRINRSCLKKDAVVYFFDLDEAEKIYKNDLRIKDKVRLTKNNETIKAILADKNFTDFYELILQDVEGRAKANNQHNIEDFRDNKLWLFDYKSVFERLKLIDDDRQMISLFLNHSVTDLEGNNLEGEKIWETYKSLLADKHLAYAEKQIKMSEIRAKMDYFIYDVDQYSLPQGFGYNEILGDLYYLYDGDQYFENGKFMREKLKNDLFM